MLVLCATNKDASFTAKHLVATSNEPPSARSGRRARAQSLTSKHPDGAGIIIESYLEADVFIGNRRTEVGRVIFISVREEFCVCTRGAVEVSETGAGPNAKSR